MKKTTSTIGLLIALVAIISCNPKKQTQEKGTLELNVKVDTTLKQEAINVSIPIYSTDTLSSQISKIKKN